MILSKNMRKQTKVAIINPEVERNVPYGRKDTETNHTNR